MQDGFLYLVAIMDWASRRVLAWRLSNTLDTEFCLEALAHALECYGTPEIFNTDQGSQFTSIAFTGLLEAAGIRCSMDGRGRCLDNVFIERLWRSLKYEAVYLHELTDGFAAQRVIAEWIEFYNEQRPHSAPGGRTPAAAYRGARTAGGVVDMDGRLQLQVPKSRGKCAQLGAGSYTHIHRITPPPSGRALARAPVGGGFPAPPFR